MKKSRLISIIVPAYNKQDSISETLQSIFAQSYNNFEIIVVDDGSTDSTKELIETYNEDITYIYQENQGQGAARNQGIKVAQGDYIVFLDADDYWELEFLQTCYDFLESHPELVAVNTAQKTYYSEAEFKIHPIALMEENPLIIKDFFDVWAKHDHIRTGTVMIRKSIVDKAGMQNAKLRVSQDLEYWGLIATYGTWGFISKPLWIGNSRIHAKKTGWSKKYSIRRRLCPDVEEWEERLIKRVQDTELEGFYRVRGRVALGYAHNKVLGGDTNGAKRIIKKYGNDFPNNSMSKLMRLGVDLGMLGWFCTVGIIKLKEFLKNI